MALPIVLFGILLPMVDNYTDLRLIIRLYTGVQGCVNTYDLPWQKVYTCQEDPVTYCQLNPNSYGCFDLKHYGDASDIPVCKEKWQNKWDCDEDPATYCKSNPNSTDCSYFERTGRPLGIPFCVELYCYRDAVRFCEHLPTSPFCGHIKHMRFATMFLGITFILFFY